MSLRAALDRIVALQLGLSITDPVVVKVKRAYKLIPSQAEQLNDLPAFINNVTYLRSRAMNAQRTVYYRVDMDCAVAPFTVEDDRNADIVVALWEQFFDDLSKDIRLGGTVTLALFEENSSELPSQLSWGGLNYLGFRASLMLQLNENFEIS